MAPSFSILPNWAQAQDNLASSLQDTPIGLMELAWDQTWLQ